MITKLIRGSIGLALCYAIAALVLGSLVTETVITRPTEFDLTNPSFADALPAGELPFPERVHVLVDARTGAIESIRPPDRERWAFLSVAPWRDREGSLLAAGRFAQPGQPNSEESQWGIGVLRLLDGRVIEKAPLDVLPVGKSCWLADSPGAILFSSTDGRLYRADLELNGDAHDRSSTTRRRSRARPLYWPRFGTEGAPIFILDPVISSDPRLRGLVFAAVLSSSKVSTPDSLPTRLWWLKLSDDGERIVADGPLQGPGPEPLDAPNLTQRYPIIAVQGDHIHLVYLTQRPAASSATLRTREIELDAQTGRPRLKARTETASAPGAPLSLSPLLLSADGRGVFALDPPGKTARMRPLPFEIADCGP